MVLATHGRAFWVLDDLVLLEQMTNRPVVAANGVQLFAPEEAWLTNSYGGSDDPDASDDAAGENPPFGATVFFHIPANYDGKTPVTLTFNDAQGQTIRSYSLHPKQKKQKNGKNKGGKMTQQQKTAVAERKATAIEPGMNRFQWDLSYPDAADVKGFYAPDAAGGLGISVQGPEVVPGSYEAVLDYGGKKSEQTFQVGLDPRINSSQTDLTERLALQMKIHTALDTLDKTINRAIAVRARLEAAVASNRINETQAAAAMPALNNAINGLVQMNIASSEGNLLHAPKLHGHLAYLEASVGLGYVKPTAAQYAVFQDLENQAQAGEQKLESAIATADGRL
ncbi:MAG: hypothetical protein ACRES7_07510 [Gammaproteobacteria bacterium]